MESSERNAVAPSDVEKASGRCFLARVLVFPRREILDPQGKAIGDALGRLGFADVAEVRAGKTFEIGICAADEVSVRARLEEICAKLLANTVTEDYSIEILSETEGGSGGEK